jgi:hypothetical protein
MVSFNPFEEYESITLKWAIFAAFYISTSSSFPVFLYGVLVSESVINTSLRKNNSILKVKQYFEKLAQSVTLSFLYENEICGTK